MAKRVRGDVLQPVLWLSTRVKSPTVSDENKLKRDIVYLKRTRERCKVISTDVIKRVEMFIDASFASHHDGARHFAMVTLVGTTEAELVALSDLYFVGLWLHSFLRSLGAPLEKPIIYQDNKSTIALVQSLLNNKPRSRHLNARRRVMYDEVMVNKNVTSEMTADVLSKQVCGTLFFKFAASIQGMPSTQF